MSATLDLVTQVPVLAGLSLAMREWLASCMSVQEYPPDHLFFAQGEPIRGLFVIAKGCAKLYRASGDRIQILALLRDGDCFGTEALSPGSRASYAAATIDNTTILFFPAEQIQMLLDAHPAFRVVLLQVATERLRQFAALVHNLAFRDVTARLATILVMRAEAEPGGLRIPRLMTQSDLAAMAGTAREVVHRTFKKFEQAGLMRVTRHHIEILDLEGLRRIAEEETR